MELQEIGREIGRYMLILQIQEYGVSLCFTTKEHELQADAYASKKHHLIKK